jgi:hypothetical protein
MAVDVELVIHLEAAVSGGAWWAECPRVTGFEQV